MLNQLGIRCKYCSHLPVSKRMRAAAYYPRTLPNLYQGAQNIAGIHFSRCTEFPKQILDFLTAERPRKVFSKLEGRIGRICAWNWAFTKTTMRYGCRR